MSIISELPMRLRNQPHLLIKVISFNLYHKHRSIFLPTIAYQPPIIRLNEVLAKPAPSFINWHRLVPLPGSLIVLVLLRYGDLDFIFVAWTLLRVRRTGEVADDSIGDQVL